jgi:hypothetical protein
MAVSSQVATQRILFLNEFKPFIAACSIDNPKANPSFFAFFEPSARFKNHQGLLSLKGLLSLIRLGTKFVVLTLKRENGNAPPHALLRL